jgi:hypothetical protein
LKPNIILALTMILSLFLSQAALAHLKTDVITLYNGDQVTGEIKSLYGGLLIHSTDSMGAIKIEWQEIANVESRFFYEVRTTTAERLFGSIGSAQRPGTLLVETAEGDRELEWLEVVELRPVEDTLRNRLDLYLSAGYSYTKASEVGQTTLSTTVSHEDENTHTALNGRTIITDTQDEDGDDTSFHNRYDLSRRLWKDRAKFYRTFGAGYEDNDELELDHRINVGAGLGRYFIDSHRMRLVASAGLQVITETFTGEDQDEDVEVFISTDFATWRFNTPELDIDLKFNLYPSITDSGRVRSDTDLNVRWEIIEDLFFDISFWASTDNHAESDRQADYGVTTGLGWKL